LAAAPRRPKGLGSALLFALGLGLLVGLDAVVGVRWLTHPAAWSAADWGAVAARWGVAAALPAVLALRLRRAAFAPVALAGAALAGAAMAALAAWAKGAPPTSAADLVIALVLLLGAGGAGALLAVRWPGRALLASFLAFLGAHAALRGLPPERSADRPAPGPQAPDVLLVTLDTLREDAVSASPRALVAGLTPQLDRLAAAGCRVDGATAPAPLTGPSHAALLTGRSPAELGLLLNARPVPDSPTWLPSAMRAAGYRTAAFVSSAMIAGRLGYSRGFDVYDDDLGGDARWRRGAFSRLSAVASARDRAHFARPGAETLSRMQAWLDDAPRDRPIFVWLHLYDAHRPYWPSAEALAQIPAVLPGLPDPAAYAGHPAVVRGVEGRADAPAAGPLVQLTAATPAGRNAARPPLETARRYLAGVADLDALVGQAWQAFSAARGGAPGAWAVTADHGESLTEHGEIGSHQHHLYRANLAVPLLLSPGPCPQGPLSTRGLAGTLLQRAGLDPAGLPRLEDGLPIDAVVRGRAHGDPDAPREAKLARREGDTKVIVGGQSGHVEVYDLSTDPHELHPLDGAAPYSLASTRADARALAPATRSDPTEDAANREALEALGYIDDDRTPQ